MVQNNYAEQMNEKPIVKVEPGYLFKKGQLFGYLSSEKIGACYPVWRQLDDEIQFVLYGLDKGKPTIDNTWIGINDSYPIYTNIEPIIIDIDRQINNQPTTFQSEIVNFFNGTL